MRVNFSYFLTVIALALSAISAQAQTSITSTAPATVGTNQTINLQYTASGFSTTVTYSETGALPPGLTLSPTGLLAGTPTSAGIGNTYTGTVTASDGVDTSATQNFSITVVTTLLNSAPEGVVTYSVTGNSVSYFSAPLSNDPVYSDVVSSVTSNTISVANTSAFTGTLANLEQPTSSVPYFVKFLSGLQAGRVLLVTANTPTTLTLDTTDHSSQTVALNASGFAVNATSTNGGPDSFEVFAGETLASMFGLNTTLVLNGGTSSVGADIVSIYSSSLSRFVSYYYNTTNGFWEQAGTSVNANNTVIYPYTCFEITRRSGALTFSVMGRVPEVSTLIKTTGNSSPVYNSTSYPVNMTLSQLGLGLTSGSCPWTEGTSTVAADTLAVWNSSLSHFDDYFQFTDGTWRKAGGGSTDVSNFVIQAGTTVDFVKRLSVSGASSYLVPVMPYSTN